MDGTGAGCSTLWLGKGSYKDTCPVQMGGDYQRQTSNADFNADGMLQEKFQRQNSNADGRPFQRRWDASRFQRRWEHPVLLLNGCPLPPTKINFATFQRRWEIPTPEGSNA